MKFLFSKIGKWMLSKPSYTGNNELPSESYPEVIIGANLAHLYPDLAVEVLYAANS